MIEDIMSDVFFTEHSANIIYRREHTTLISKKPYSCWEDIQDEFEDYQTNLNYTYADILDFLRQYRTKIVRRLRRQIFRQIVQIRRRRADARQGEVVQDDGKYASKRRAKPEGRSLCGVALIEDYHIDEDEQRALIEFFKSDYTVFELGSTNKIY